MTSSTVVDQLIELADSHPASSPQGQRAWTREDLYDA